MPHCTTSISFGSRRSTSLSGTTRSRSLRPTLFLASSIPAVHRFRPAAFWACFFISRADFSIVLDFRQSACFQHRMGLVGSRNLRARHWLNRVADAPRHLSRGLVSRSLSATADHSNHPDHCLFVGRRFFGRVAPLDLSPSKTSDRQILS